MINKTQHNERTIPPSASSIVAAASVAGTSPSSRIHEKRAWTAKAASATMPTVAAMAENL